MIRTLSKKPINRAEAIFYDFLKNTNLNGHAWFGLELTGTNEIDCLLWLDNVGWFVIEIKGFKIKDFKSVCKQNITYNYEEHQKSYGHKPTAWTQASIARKILAAKINNKYFNASRNTKFQFQKGEKHPYISSLAYFPNISSKEFEDNFPNTYFEIKDETLFNDLHLSENVLEETLSRNVRIQNRYASKNVKYDEALGSFYDEKIFNYKEEIPVTEKYDNKLIKLLENDDYIKETSTINFDFPVLRIGFAGTGKTILGLKILERYANNDNKVLFVCFNKVLASDIRRLIRLSIHENYKYFENIEVKDIFQIIDEYSDSKYSLDIGKRETNFDEIASNSVKRIIESGFFSKVYHYIVVDEAQDLKDYAWNLIYYLSLRGTDSIAVLNGKEQNLYLNKPSNELKKYEYYAQKNQDIRKLKNNVAQKRRVYRNKTNSFLFAQSFLNIFPDTSKAISFIENNQSKSDPTFDFMRDEGSFPKLVLINDDSSLEKSLKNIIEGTLKEIKEHNLSESGLIIATPYALKKSQNADNYYIKKITQFLNKNKINYIDYTNSELRRIEYHSSQVRIIPYHSLRGVESEFTILVGFEELPKLTESIDINYHNLGYIALSRAKFDTYIIYDNQKATKHNFPFIEYCKSLYNELAPGEKLIYST